MDKKNNKNAKKGLLIGATALAIIFQSCATLDRNVTINDIRVPNNPNATHLIWEGDVSYDNSVLVNDFIDVEDTRRINTIRSTANPRGIEFTAEENEEALRGYMNLIAKIAKTPPHYINNSTVAGLQDEMREALVYYLTDEQDKLSATIGEISAQLFTPQQYKNFRDETSRKVTDVRTYADAYQARLTEEKQVERAMQEIFTVRLGRTSTLANAQEIINAHDNYASSLEALAETDGFHLRRDSDINLTLLGSLITNRDSAFDTLKSELQEAGKLGSPAQRQSTAPRP